MSALSKFVVERDWSTAIVPDAPPRTILSCQRAGCDWELEITFMQLDTVVEQAHEHWWAKHAVKGEAWTKGPL